MKRRRLRWTAAGAKAPNRGLRARAAGDLYDWNPLDANFSENTAGRLTATRYRRKTSTDGSRKPLTFIEMYSYTPAGLPTKKALLLQREHEV